LWHYNKNESCEPKRSGSGFKYKTRAKASMRLRVRTEWIPLRLPVNLRIVEPDQWQRVQEQVSRNKVFSPRNSRHSYLLTGLVRCTGCGSRFVGDPSHGKFYYRCHKRCKKVRSVKEEDLDSAVWSAVREAVLTPELIAEQLEDFEARRAAAAASA